MSFAHLAKILPLPLLLYYLYPSQLTGSVLSIMNNSSQTFLSIGLVFLLVLWVVKNRRVLGFFASNSHGDSYSGIGLLSLAFCFYIAGSYAQPKQPLHWLSLGVFVMSYVVTIYGRSMIWYTIPTFLSFFLLYDLSLLNYGLAYATVSFFVAKDTLSLRRKSSLCDYQNHSSFERFCPKCGELNSEIEMSFEQQKTYRRAIVGIAVITLLTFAYGSIQVPALTLVSGELVVANYTPRGTSLESILGTVIPSTQSDSRFDYEVTSSSNGDRYAPLRGASQGSKELLEYRISSAVYERYPTNGTNKEALDLRARLPYVYNSTLLARVWGLHVIADSPVSANNRGLVLKQELTEFGSDVDRKLALLAGLTVAGHSLFAISNLLIPFLPTVAAIGLVLGLTMVVRKADEARDYVLDRIFVLSENEKYIAMSSMTRSSGWRKALSGWEIYQEAQRFGFSGSLEEVVVELDKLHGEGILTTKWAVRSGKVRRLWSLRGI